MNRDIKDISPGGNPADTQLGMLIRSIPETETPQGMEGRIMERIKGLEEAKSGQRDTANSVISGIAAVLLFGILITAAVAVTGYPAADFFSKAGKMFGQVQTALSEGTAEAMSSWGSSPLVRLGLPLAAIALLLMAGDLYLRRWYNKRNPDDMVS